MPDYSKGKIYTIRCRNDETLIYVGSTTQPLSKRWGGHKAKSKIQGNRLIYSTINNEWDNWYIELFQEYQCENKEQLEKREGEIIREIGTLNYRIEGRNKKEYQKENKDVINERNKKYQQLNKVEIKEYLKKYQQLNKNEIKEKSKTYYEANKNEIIERNKTYYKVNREKISEKRRENYHKKKLEYQSE